MKIRRFFGPDPKQTMRRIRRELGPDAVILCCRSVEGGSEILAAIDPAVADTHVDARRPAGQQSQAINGNLNSDRSYGMPAPLSELSVIRRELAAMRHLLTDRISHPVPLNMSQRRPVASALVDRLTECGITESLACQLVQDVAQDDLEEGWHGILVRLSQRLRVTDDMLLRRGGRFVLLGPTGSGKTTILAKLAARFTLRHGPRQVGLISMDRRGIGAAEQFRHFAEMLDLPARSVTTASELQKALKEYDHYRLVLVDTTGLGSTRPGAAKPSRILARIPGLQPQLVVAANIATGALQRWLADWQRDGLRAAILTKLDETEGLGDVLSTFAIAGLPLSYLSTGTRVPDDLEPARSARLVARALAASQNANRADNQSARQTGIRREQPHHA